MSWNPPEIFEAAGLLCRRVSPAAEPRLLVLLCHGYGAPGTDLVPLAGELMRSSERIAAHALFLFPQAPLSLGGFPGFDQRAWWPIDVAALEAAILRGEGVDRRMHCPGELPDLRARLRDVLAAEEDRSGLGIERAVLGGFSQGAMLTTDLTLHLEDDPAALVIFSGTLLCEADWRRTIGARSRSRELRVLQSHGRHDPLLPFGAAEALRDLLRSGGADVEFVPFDGQHELPMPGLAAFRDLLVSLLEREGGGR